MMATMQLQKCPDCNSSDLKHMQLKHDGGRTEDIAVCQNCNRHIFPDVEYVYLVKGVAKNWASPEDLTATIEDILRAYMPPTDVAQLRVEVAELA